MANNKATITTMPLKAKLNMNYNKELVNSDYDQVNDINSPLYGGLLSPMVWRKSAATGYGVYDKHGNHYTVTSDGIMRKNGNVIFGATEEINSSNANMNYTFHLHNVQLPFEPRWDTLVTNIDEDTYAPEQSVFYFTAFSVKDGDVLAHKMVYYGEGYADAAQAVSELSSFHLLRPNYCAEPVDLRIVGGNAFFDEGEFGNVIPSYGNYTTQPHIFVLYKSAQAGRYMYCLVDYGIDGTLFNAKQLNLYRYNSPTAIDEESGKLNGGLSNGDVDNNAQLIVSDPFVFRSGDSTWDYVYGITVLNHKQRAGNGHKEFLAVNTYVGLETNDKRTFTPVIGDRVFIIPGTTAVAVREAKLGSDGSWSWDTETGAKWTGTPWGIFCDESNYVYAGTTWNEKTRPGGDNGNDVGCAWACRIHEYGSNSPMMWLAQDSDDAGHFPSRTLVLNTTDAGRPGLLETSMAYETDSNDDFGTIPYTILPCLVTNQRHHRLVVGGLNKTSTEKTNVSAFLMLDNMTGCRVSRMPGVSASFTLPTSDKGWTSTDSSDNSIWYNRYTKDYSLYNTSGSMAQVNHSPFRVLFNYKEGYISGISWADTTDSIGTLLTPWNQVDDSFFVHAYGNLSDGNSMWCSFKGTTSTNSISIIHAIRMSCLDKESLFTSEGWRLLSVFGDRYVLQNTSNYYNCYDIETGKVSHWGSDWNNRIIGGFENFKTVLYNGGNAITDNSETFSRWDGNVRYVRRLQVNWTYEGFEVRQLNTWKPFNGTTYGQFYPFIYNKYWDSDRSNEVVKKWSSSVSEASGVDVSYIATKTFTPSAILPYQNMLNYVEGFEQVVAASSPPLGDTGRNLSPPKIDYFFSPGTATPSYKTSFYGSPPIRYWNIWVPSTTSDGALVGTSYPATSSSTVYYNMPITGIEFINSFAGKFGVKMGGKAYNIQYNGIRPVAIYNSTSMLDEVDTFFIVQSQYYAVINGYVCSVSYSSSNVLNGVEQVVNVSGMQFIGALPTSAYFYSPSDRAIFAFTGDADLKLFVQTDQIKEIRNYCYAPNNEWIYIYTNNGYYVITQQNVFRLPDIFWGDDDDNSEVCGIYATDRDYNIIDLGEYSILLGMTQTYWKILPTYVDTEYFGPGDMKQEVFDCVYIRFCYRGDEHYIPGTVEIESHTLTDIDVKSEKQAFTISEEMLDVNGCYTYRYQPQYQKGQGLRLKVTSKVPIANISFSHQMDGTMTDSNSTFNVVDNLRI